MISCIGGLVIWGACQVLPLGPGWASAYPAYPAEPVRSPPLRVVGLGDSLLVRPDSWFRLVCATGELGACTNAGVSGDTTPGMQSRLASDVLNRQPTAMVLMGGTNDLPLDTPTAQIVDQLAQITTAARSAGIRVVLCTVPPRDRYRAQVIDLNAAIRRYAVDAGLPLLDMYGVIGTPDGTFDTGLSSDGVHPNGAGNARMADLADHRLPALLHPH